MITETRTLSIYKNCEIVNDCDSQNLHSSELYIYDNSIIHIIQLMSTIVLLVTAKLHLLHYTCYTWRVHLIVLH